MSMNDIEEIKKIKDFKFPIEIKALFENFGNSNQWRILEILVQNNNKLSYTDLMKSILQSEGIAKGTFNYHLDSLEQAGWLRNWTSKGADLSEREVSNYEINKFAMKIVAGTLRAMNKRNYILDPHLEVKMLVVENLPEMMEFPFDAVTSGGVPTVFVSFTSDQGFSKTQPIEVVTSGKRVEAQSNLQQRD